ncbi:TPM domain-containing protein [Lutimaribacter marinistellae]|uniref:TPM domain-containing protein n=1 Tax=Lutimaribacter marinistellae TaxID=1820329 RepID=A0ABV7TMP8_9RHOB
MTKRDLEIALAVVFAVVVTGWLIGFAVGWATRPDTVVETVAPEGPPERAVAPQDGPVDGAGGVSYPGYEEIHVNDYADLLREAAEDRVRQDLKDLYDRTGIEMTVLTLSNMAAYGHDGPIEPFATGLFNAWGIGHAVRNDGVLVLVVVDDRHMRIEIGAGYDQSWDARMQRVIDDGFLPHFRNEKYERGIETGVEETIHELTGRYPGEDEIGTAARGWAWILRQLRKAGDWIWSLLLIPLGGAALGLRHYLRVRPRPCPHCRVLMARMGEAADDEHLDGGQRLEEYLQSVDYDVWACADCDHKEIIRYPSLFSAHGTCPRCDYRTLASESTTLEAATTSSSGRKRVDYHCQQCDYEDSEIRTIPRKSSGGSGGSGGSFGGGSSSGGGASGSW